MNSSTDLNPVTDARLLLVDDDRELCQMLCEYLQAERFEVHSLFFRIFILFWVAMALIVGGSMALTLAVASRDNESSDTERRPEMAVRASQVLAGGGIGDLRQCGPACSAR